MKTDDTRVEYAHAVFVSYLATGSQPGAAHVLAAVRQSRDRCACLGGCEGLVAQEYGEHPDTAARRMRWALQLVHDMPVSPVRSTVERVPDGLIERTWPKFEEVLRRNDRGDDSPRPRG
jgi:hypothetical protein